MTAAAARATKPAARGAARAATPRTGYLRLVTARRSSAARAPFVATVVVILAAGLLGLLLLNTVLAQDAFRLHALQIQGRVLADHEQTLQREVERLQSPQSLAARAGRLDMVPGGPPAFLRLSDGKVLGTALPGQAPLVLAPPKPPAAAVVAKAPTVATPRPGAWVVVRDKPARPVKPAAKPAPPAPRPTPGAHR
jgi:hypothetical protein